MKKGKIILILIITIVVVGLGSALVVYFGDNEKTKDAQPSIPPCTADTTISCSDGSVIITQSCSNGTLINTGKICPCTSDVTITCGDGSVVITQDCVNGTFIDTGKVCPCFSDNIQTCYNGSKVTIQNCVNGTLINTENACPSPPALPAPPVEQIEITAQRLQNIFQKSEYFTRLPENAAIYLHFWNGNGNPRTETFFIGSGGQISAYAGQKYDVELGVGDYNIKRLEDSGDLCTTLKQIKDEQDLLAKLNKFFSFGKYLYMKSCVPF